MALPSVLIPAMPVAAGYIVHLHAKVSRRKFPASQ
ncbi:hypothetical protein B0I32_14017 [Nonomuraea fuscirosea]|uniref:Uncharacterized protein n=1 Tax=Nonomuraea fuscirosea TaxID=1291556 RepID=A0A2T0LXM0_9ACTN|nr:hypothetical protein B0I32_14017 [Nonomuraea fuscirosea]